MDRVSLWHHLQGCPTVISRTVLVAATSFGATLDAERVASSLGAGLLAADATLALDLCPLQDRLPANFDARMRASRAVVIAQAHLEAAALPASLAFEIATRARQGGVPAYAVSRGRPVDPFEARLLDLQVVLTARTTRELDGCGRRLAMLL
jgi:hypothetical protein